MSRVKMGTLENMVGMANVRRGRDGGIAGSWWIDHVIGQARGWMVMERQRMMASTEDDRAHSITLATGMTAGECERFLAGAVATLMRAGQASKRHACDAETEDAAGSAQCSVCGALWNERAK